MRAGRIDPHARDLLLLPHGNGLAWPLQDDDDVGGLLGRAAIGINDRAKEKQLRTGETIIYLHGALRSIRHQHLLGRIPKHQEHGPPNPYPQTAPPPTPSSNSSYRHPTPPA